MAMGGDPVMDGATEPYYVVESPDRGRRFVEADGSVWYELRLPAYEGPLDEPGSAGGTRAVPSVERCTEHHVDDVDDGW